MASPNALALALELLGHAEVPLRLRAVALRKAAKQTTMNAAAISRTPTGACAELEGLCRSMAGEATMMRREAERLDRLADAQESEPAATPEAVDDQMPLAKVVL